MKGTGKNRMRMPALAAVLLASTGMIGCSNTADIQSLRSQVDAAAADAMAARSEAAEAKAIALKAMNTANTANATSNATEAKIDRMFKKAMYK